METCEKCGATFEPLPRSGEVVSLRILCPPCEEEKRATRMTRTAGAAPPGDARPPRAPEAPPREGAAPPTTTARRASTRATSTVRRESVIMQAEVNRSTMVGMIIAGVLVVVAGAVVFVVKTKKNRERRQEEAYSQRVERLRDQLLALDLANEEDADRFLQLLETDAGAEKLQEEKLIAEILPPKIALANGTRQAARDRRDLTQRFARIQEDLQRSESLTSDETAELRRSLEDIEARAGLVGADFVAEVARTRAGLDRLTVTKLREEAAAAAAAAPGRPALLKYARAEDETQKLLDRAHLQKNQEAKAEFEKLFREIIEESDVVCAKVFTPEAVERTPWKDLLAGEDVRGWQRTELQGFEARVDNGVLHLIARNTTSQGLFYWGEGLRDFLLDLEFTLDSGSVTLAFRMGRSMVNAQTFEVSTTGPGALTPGKRYEAEVSLIGSRLSIRFRGDELSPHDPPPLSWTRSRKGTLALLAGDGTKARFTRIRIRELR